MSRGGSQSVQKWSVRVILWIRDAKNQYFVALQHFYFVDSMWPSGAHGVSRVLWLGLGGARELQECLWGSLWGSKDELFCPRKPPGATPKLKTIVLGCLLFYPKRSIFANRNTCVWRPSWFTRVPSGRVCRSMGVLGGAWVDKSMPGLTF